MDIHQGMAERFGREFTDADLHTINTAHELANCVAYRAINERFDMECFEYSTSCGITAIQSREIFSLKRFITVQRIRYISVLNVLGVAAKSTEHLCVAFPLLHVSLNFACKSKLTRKT